MYALDQFASPTNISQHADLLEVLGGMLRLKMLAQVKTIM